MKSFEGRYPNKMFKEVAKYILENGDEIAPRGQPTKEVCQVANVWTEPVKSVITLPRRKANPFFTLFESLWIMGGRADADSVCYYNSNLKTFLDEDDKEFNAPYGRRIRHWGKHKNILDNLVFMQSHYTKTYVDFDQFKDCYELLKNDKDTRQAVISLWVPFFDNSTIKTNDRPCNDLVFLKIRNNKLNMTVVNRSNDFLWGLYSTNIVQFSMMQRILASLLCIEVGIYTHFSDSLHIYHTRDTVSEDILNAPYEFDVYDYVTPYDLMSEYDGLKDFDKKLSDFFRYEENIRSHKVYIPLDNYEEMENSLKPFLWSSLLICQAYVKHKEKKYLSSLTDIIKAHSLGNEDFAISCMEFVMRKYQLEDSKNNTDYSNDLFLGSIKNYLKIMYTDDQVKEITRYIESH